MDSKMLSGFCPNCRAKLNYSTTDISVECNCCDSNIRAADILTSKQLSPRATFSAGAGMAAGGAMMGGAPAGAMAVAMQGIDSPESALVYLQNFYDRFDWAHFKLDGDLYPAEVMEMVEDRKMKSGATPSVWLLDFEARIVPLNKNLDALEEFEQKMVEVYDGFDYAKVLEVYKDYSFLMNLLLDNKEEIFADLNAAVEYARQFKLEANKFTQMQTKLADFKNRFEKIVHEITEIGDEPVIKKAKKASDEKVAAQLLEKGIEASGTYQAAVDAFNRGDFSAAANLFSKIIGYADASEYLRKLGNDFLFHNSIIRIGEKEYYLRPSTAEDYTFDVAHPEEEGAKKKGAGCGGKGKKKEEAAPAEEQKEEDPNVYQGAAYSLFAINEEHLVAKDKVLAAGITQVITTYAGKLLFIQKDKDICVFDSFDNSVKVVHSGEEGDYSVNVAGKARKSNVFYYNKDKTGIFFRKKLELEKEEEPKKAGCKDTLKNLFKKNKQEVAPKMRQFNNFSLLYLDLATFELSEIVHELVDVLEYKDFGASRGADMLRGAIANYGDVIFYVYAEKLPEVKKDPKKEKEGEEEKPEEPKTEIRIYSLRARKEIGIIESDYEVNAVVGQHVIYSQWTPNDWNKRLFVLNTETGEKTLIEENIYDFYFANVDHIFYTVGNDSYSPLFSNNYQGTERREVMKKLERIVALQSGWMYVIKGRGINSALLKISEDGQQRVVVATQFKQAIKITPSTIFYCDQFGNLCCAKVDGSDQRTIMEDVNPANVIIDDNAKHILFFRYEAVGHNNKKAFSLYRVDLKGDNLEKLVFSVLSGKDCRGTDLVYLYTEEHQTFEFTDYDEKGNELKSEVPYVLRKYQTFNKVTGEFATVMTSDPLTAEPIEFRYGCFKRKKKTLTPTYVLIPNKVEIYRKNVAKAGAVTEEKEEAELQQQALQQEQTANAGGCSKSLGKKEGGESQPNAAGGCLGGCAKLIKKK